MDNLPRMRNDGSPIPLPPARTDTAHPQTGDRVDTPHGSGQIVFVWFNSGLKACQYQVRLTSGKSWWFNADALTIIPAQGQPA